MPMAGTLPILLLMATSANGVDSLNIVALVSGIWPPSRNPSTSRWSSEGKKYRDMVVMVGDQSRMVVLVAASMAAENVWQKVSKFLMFFFALLRNHCLLGAREKERGQEESDENISWLRNYGRLY